MKILLNDSLKYCYSIKFKTAATLLVWLYDANSNYTTSNFNWDLSSHTDKSRAVKFQNDFSGSIYFSKEALDYSINTIKFQIHRRYDCRKKQKTITSHLQKKQRYIPEQG